MFKSFHSVGNAPPNQCFPNIALHNLLTLRHPYTPNANMADHSVVARDELHESEVSEASICSVLFRCAYELLCF